jgi:hypothetical protein
MQEHTPTGKEVARFERLAADPHTSEVMASLAQNLCFNFNRPARVFLEIAASQLGLNYALIDSFHEWWAFDRVSVAA